MSIEGVSDQYVSDQSSERENERDYEREQRWRAANPAEAARQDAFNAERVRQGEAERAVRDIASRIAWLQTGGIRNRQRALAAYQALPNSDSTKAAGIARLQRELAIYENELRSLQAGNPPTPGLIYGGWGVNNVDSFTYPPSAADAGDPYGPFKSAFKTAFGRDAAADDWAQAALPQYSNELLMTLPDNVLQWLPVQRLLKLPNEGLIRAARLNPNILTQVPPDRFKTMPRDYVDREALPFLNGPTGNTTVAAAVRAALGPASVTPPATTTPPPTTPAGPAPTTTTPVRSLEDIIARLGGSPIRLTGEGAPTAQELNYYFDFANQPSLAAVNAARAYGIQQGTGNPLGAFLTQQFGPLADMSAIYRAFAGQDAPALGAGQEGAEGTVQTLQDVFGRLGGGATSAVSPTEGRSFAQNLSKLFDDVIGGKITNPNQVALAERFKDFDEAFRLYTDLTGQSRSPLMRDNLQATMSRLYQTYRDRAAQNQNLTPFQFLTGLAA